MSGTATWGPNPITENVVQYTVQLNALPAVVVLPASCTASVCTQTLPSIPLAANTLTLTAQNEVITGGPLQSGPPTVLSFTINAKPVTILVLHVTVP